MKYVPRLFPALATAAFAFTLVTLGAARAETSRQTFDVASGDRLVVDTERGSIEIDTWDKSTVEIVVENADKLDLEFDQADGTVSVHGHKKGSGISKLFDWGWSNGPKFRITVPRIHDVELKTSGGGISIDDLQGQVHARTSGGGLHFGQIDGPVEGKTSGGSIDLKGCTGTANVSTSGGSIRIGDVDGDVQAKTSGGSIHIARAQGTVQAKTSGGSIKVDEVMGAIDAKTSGGSIHAQLSNQPQGPCILSTSGGNVEVSLAEDIALDVDAKTSGGRVSTDFPVTGEGSMMKNSLNTEINGGGPPMTLRTSGGSIRLRKM